MIFKTPWIIFLLPFVLAGVMAWRKRQKTTSIRFSSTRIVASLAPTWKVRLRYLPDILRLLTLVLFFLALAGPRSVLEETVHKTEGIDIVLTIDSSGSMAAEDFVVQDKRVNRLAIVKDVVKEFIHDRENDRLGLVAFAAVAYTVSPLTTDHSWLLANLERIRLGLIQDGTAIGSAIASSVGRLKNSDAKSKVIILLTDGVNNAGKMDPIEAARLAEAFGVKIYTIGAGTTGLVPFPAQDPWGRIVYQNVAIKLDEPMLRKVAEITQGKYFHATDTESLRKIYQEIDSLERVKIEEHGYREYREWFGYVLGAALFLLAGEIILTRTIFLKVP